MILKYVKSYARYPIPYICPKPYPIPQVQEDSGSIEAGVGILKARGAMNTVGHVFSWDLRLRV